MLDADTGVGSGVGVAGAGAGADVGAEAGAKTEADIAEAGDQIWYGPKVIGELTGNLLWIGEAAAEL
jgi:hypothetical protein